ncbi:MAG: BLUF domain-containing protein [Burkholderiales bacterium]
MLRVVYVSAATILLDADELVSILRVSRANNAQRDITGLLLYRDGDIMQVLEGDAQRVRELIAILERDPRHHRLTVIHEEEATERLFGDWTMGFHDLAAAAPVVVEGFNHCMRGRDADGLPPAAGRAVIELLTQFRDAR